MILRYGNYFHAQGENWWLIQIFANHSRIGLLRSFTHRWTIWGTKIQLDADQTALTAQLALLEDAYDDGFDVGIYEPDGTTLSKHFILNSTTVDGVRIKEFRYLDRDPRWRQSGTEYVNKRTYRIVLEAEIIPNGVPSILSWEEMIVGIGNGGPLFIHKGALTGPAQRQILQQQTVSRGIQWGRAVGLLGYPTPASPLAPNDEHQDKRRITQRTPKFGVKQNTEFPIEWRYEFSSPTAFTGTPTPF